jgi:hypothetical protein
LLIENGHDHMTESASSRNPFIGYFRIKMVAEYGRLCKSIFSPVDGENLIYSPGCKGQFHRRKRKFMLGL